MPFDSPLVVLGASGSVTALPEDIRFTAETRATATSAARRVVVAGIGQTPEQRAGTTNTRCVIDLEAGVDRAIRVRGRLLLPNISGCAIAADGTVFVGDSARLDVWRVGADASRPVVTLDHAIDALDCTARPRPRIALGVGPALVVLPIGPDGTPDAARPDVVATGPDTFGKYVMVVAWSPDGTRIAAGIRDREVRVYDVATRRLVGTPVSLGGTPRSILWSAAGGALVIADTDSVTLCDADTGTKFDEVRPGWKVTAIALEDAPGGGLVIAGGNGDGRLLRLPFARE